MPKLTINAEPEVIALAKKLAKERGISVSEMFFNIIRSMATTKRSDQLDLGPRTREASGLVKWPEGETRSYRELIEEAIAERYLR